jgi:hypothetical protein
MSAKDLVNANEVVSSVSNSTDMIRRFYFEKTETITKQSKGWIEVDMDFVQVYDSFSKFGVKVKSIVTFKLLFWLLSHEVNKKNGISSGQVVYDRFNNFLNEQGAEIIAMRTFQNSFEELIKIEALTRVGKGHYYFSPYLFWKDSKKERIDFLTDEAKDKKPLSTSKQKRSL